MVLTYCNQPHICPKDHIFYYLAIYFVEEVFSQKVCLHLWCFPTELHVKTIENV